MKIAIGTKSPPKVEAIKLACKEVIYFEGKNIEVIPEKSDSEVSDMPLSLEENMLGAKNRAENLFKNGIKADFLYWNGRLNYENQGYYILFGVVYIFDGKNGYYGISNMLPIPEYISDKLYNEKLELGDVISEITKTENVGHKNGTFGMLSDDMLLRSEQFLLAFKSAICPFIINIINKKRRYIFVFLFMLKIFQKKVKFICIYSLIIQNAKRNRKKIRTHGARLRYHYQ